MSLDRVLLSSAKKLPTGGGGPALSYIPNQPVRSEHQRPAIASTRAWIFDTEKLVQNVRYAEQSSAEMRGASARVLIRDKKETRQRAATVDREVQGTVDSTAATTHQLEKAIAQHEAELVHLLQERNKAREVVGRVVKPLEHIRKRIELRLGNPLPEEERTDTSVLESLQIVSRSLSESARTLVAFIKDTERHCTHMESLRQAVRAEISDRRESMKVTFAGSHEVPALPPIHGKDGQASEYAQMLKSDMNRCFRLSHMAIAESVLLRAKLAQCAKDVEIVRKRNEKLLSITLEAHVRDTEMLQNSISARKTAVKVEIERLKESEKQAQIDLENLQAPTAMALSKLRDRKRYARVLRDGRAQDSVSIATAEETIALKGAVQDAQRCKATLAKHRQRLEGFYDQLSNAESSKAKVMQLALSTAIGERVEPSVTASPRAPAVKLNGSGTSKKDKVSSNGKQQ